jgi:hypothetical protein
MGRKKAKPNYRRIILRLPDLDHSKLAVLNSLTSPNSRRVYKHAIEKFIAWYCSEPQGQMKQTFYLYDDAGRLASVRDESTPDATIVFSYDEGGRKTKTSVCRPEDYRPNTAIAGSPFEAADHAPNLPGGGTATTLYDEQDRPTEVQVRNKTGEVVNRAVRTYDAQGHVAEEQQILDKPELLFPPEHIAKMIEESGVPEAELMQELRTKLTDFMSGQPGPSSISYRYDTQGRRIHTSRRFFNRYDEIDTTYDDHGDVESEIERSTRPDSSPSFYEVLHSYTYDQHGNWTEQQSSHRSSPDADFQALAPTKRSLNYY